MQATKRVANHTRRLLGRTVHRATTSRAFSSGAVVNPTDGLSEEQAMLFDMARDFAEAEMKPHAIKWDETKHCPYDVLKRTAELGFGGLYISPESGGTGLSRHDTTLVVEALSTADVSVTALLTIHNMTAWMLDSFGSPALKEKYLQAQIQCEKFGSYCLTEPGSGSDAAALKTSAKREGDHYVLNGSKSFISGGGYSDLYYVMCRTGDESAGGISCIVVEKGTEGLSFGAQEKKMGWRNQPTSMVFFDNVKVPVENLVGEEGSGFKIAMMGLDGGRLNIAATSLGGAQRCFDDALQYVSDRKQFKKPLSANQSVQFKLAEMAIQLHASRLMLRSSAGCLDNGTPDKTAKCAMAKKFVTDACFDICNDALQLHGGYGYLQDYEVERFVRDVRVNQILEGTNQIMQLIISRQLLAQQ